MSLGKAGMPLGCVVVDFLVGFRFSSWVFFISLLSLAGMARPGCGDGDWTAFKCHENAIFKGGQKRLISVLFIGADLTACGRFINTAKRGDSPFL